MGPRLVLKSSLYTIIYDLCAETRHTSSVYDAAHQKDCLYVLVKELHLVFKNYTPFTK